MPEWGTAHDAPGRRLTREDRERMAALAEEAREAAPPGREADAEARALETLPFVAGAYTREEIESAAPGDSVLRLLRSSHRPDRTREELARSGVFVVGQPGMYMSTSATGSGHGTPWHYDRSVPLVFLGSGVWSGRHADPARTVDLAPTLARLGGIPAPADLDGRPLAVHRSPGD